MASRAVIRPGIAIIFGVKFAPERVAAKVRRLA